MEQPDNKLLLVGDWSVDPTAGQIARNGDKTRLDARTMRLLVCLAEHAGETVSIDDLLNEVWAGVIVTPDSVYQAVASLRRLLGDDPKQPAYIATVPRLGYRMVARVSPAGQSTGTRASHGADTGADTGADKYADDRAGKRAENAAGNGTPADAEFPRRSNGPAPPPAPPPAKSARTTWLAVGIVLVLLVAAVSAFLLRARQRKAQHPVPVAAVAPANSVAVLPFLDLTEGMKEEEFADGITEELIDKVSRIPGISVPSATASFYYKGRQTPVAEIARSLGVTYVLDGSVRKSGTWIRVDARLVRAATGYVIWSDTYDQPAKNLLMIQDDIAGAVAKSLRSSIGSTAKP